MSSFIRNQYNNKATSDIKVIFNSEIYFLHKLILRQIPYFESIIEEFPQKDEITATYPLYNMPNFIFEYLIKYHYQINSYDLHAFLIEFTKDYESNPVQNMIDLLNYFVIIEEKCKDMINYIIFTPEIRKKYIDKDIKFMITHAPEAYLRPFKSILDRDHKTIMNFMLKRQKITPIVHSTISKDEIKKAIDIIKDHMQHNVYGLIVHFYELTCDINIMEYIDLLREYLIYINNEALHNGEFSNHYIFIKLAIINEVFIKMLKID